jgi:hypothetical protein
MADPEQATGDEGEAGGAAAEGPPPKKYTREPLPGGHLPNIGELFNETLAEFQDNIGPYALASLGHTLVVMPLVMVAIFGMYFLMIMGFFGGTMVSVLAGVVVSEVIHPDLGALVMGVGYLLSMVLPFLAIFFVIGLMIGVMAPLQASLVRAVAAHQRGEAELDLSAAFSTVTQDLVSVLIAGTLLGTMTTVGVMLFILPGLLVPVFFGFAMGLVAINRRGGIEGVRMALQHALGHMEWHVTFGVLSIGLTMIASYVPIIGPAFAVAFHVRAHRQLFGDDVEPVLSAA